MKRDGEKLEKCQNHFFGINEKKNSRMAKGEKNKDSYIFRTVFKFSHECQEKKDSGSFRIVLMQEQKSDFTWALIIKAP